MAFIAIFAFYGFHARAVPSVVETWKITHDPETSTELPLPRWLEACKDLFYACWDCGDTMEMRSVAGNP